MNAWFKEIERARTEAEIVAGARDYCSLLHPRELDVLPQDCRDIRIEGGTDIARLEAQLSAGFARVAGDASEAQPIRQLVDYLVRANDRLRELHTPQ